jgi:putative glutamine amidotransferase
VERGTPVLGICRGIQVINVALGGDLLQDLPEHDHYSTGESRQLTPHHVRVADGSQTAAVLGASQVPVNSLHHQAVGRVAPGLRASGWSDDGVVEAVESPDGRLLAVQWHPEELIDGHAHSRRIFKWLVEKARVASSAGRSPRRSASSQPRTRA